MKGCLHIVRGSEKKLTLPGPSVQIKNDGTIWYEGNPLLGIDDPAVKARVVILIKAHKYSAIPAEYYTRLGDNPNGLWAGNDAAWSNHPVKIVADHKAIEQSAQAAKMVSIHLSSRGWGDYSSLTWHGDITRPDSEILAECRKALASANDVDQPNQSDNELIGKIVSARTQWAGKPAREAEEIRYRESLKINGCCPKCGTWCYGDCSAN